MAEIGYGYGSEWHLMRFMARHRDVLEEIIRRELGVDDNNKDVFHWLDFDFNINGNGITLDDELKGLSFIDKASNIVFDPEVVKTIDSHYIKGWKSGRGAQSWDAVFTYNNTIYLVEAKARIGEIKDSRKNHGGESKEIIKDLMTNQLIKFGIQVSDAWMGEYYQLANRLTTAALLNNCGIKAKCLYLYFLNGYDKPNDNQNAEEKSFKKAVDDEMNALGLDPDSVKQLYIGIYIDCLKDYEL